MTAPLTWLVTGGSRGIGAAIVRRALDAGDRVAVLARSPSALADPDLQVVAVEADVTDRVQIERAVRDVADALGPVDVLVNNAAVHRGGRIGKLTPDDWDAVLGANVTGVFNVTRAVVPLMGDGAAIVNVGAVVGFRGFPGDVAYGTSKAALLGLTRVLAVELAPRRIRVNLVLPGFVETDMTASLSSRAREALVGRIPLGRPATRDEIAHVVETAARATYMTGSVVAVDGGLLAALGGES